MTRVNAGIHPRELPSKLLIAEHHEIIRIPNLINSGRASLKGIPERFSLGTGHVKFFYNKLTYLLNRYRSIRRECLLRDFEVQDLSICWDGIPEKLFNDWTPSEADRQIIINRIKSRGFELLSLESFK